MVLTNLHDLIPYYPPPLLIRHSSPLLLSYVAVVLGRYDESGTIRHDSAANLSVVAVDECVHYILSESGPESILHRLHLMEPLFVKPPPGQPTLIDAVGQQFAGRHADSDVYDSALSLLTCLAGTLVILTPPVIHLFYLNDGDNLFLYCNSGMWSSGTSVGNIRRTFGHHVVFV